MFDDYHKKLGSEMYTYLNVPIGDQGLSDYRHKFSCEANKRYFIFGTGDGFGYYSGLNAPDVIPSQNILRIRKEPTGCVAVGADVLLFSKLEAERITVLDNANSNQDDSFLNVGCSSHESIVRLTDDVVAWMSYRGPYRTERFIGLHLKKWWDETLTDAQKEACVGAFNHRKNQILFSFPTYTDSDFSNGIIFVYDLNAVAAGYGSAWWYFAADNAVNMQTLNDDGHLLTASATKIVDWNADTANETVSSLLKLLLLKGPKYTKRIKTLFKKVFVDYTSDDTITARIYKDGSGTPVNLTMNATTLEAFISYLGETLELEVITSASSNTLEYSRLQLELKAMSK